MTDTQVHHNSDDYPWKVGGMIYADQAKAEEAIDIALAVYPDATIDLVDRRTGEIVHTSRAYPLVFTLRGVRLDLPSAYDLTEQLKESLADDWFETDGGAPFAIHQIRFSTGRG